MNRYYIVKHKNMQIRLASRSGGVFTALSDAWLSRGGVIYGCVLDENLKACHVRASSPAERDCMRGSKYVQSDMGRCFSEIKKDLNAGKYVLFSGTSCQVAGLRAFLGERQDKLLCIDIVCHGVPSPLVWSDYLNYWRNKTGKEIVSVDFRNKKKYGWASHIETIALPDKKIDTRIFTELFYQHRILRPSCYQCPYKSLNHPGDITIADAWGVQKANPDFDDNKGVSLIMVNTSLGEDVLRYVKRDCDIEDVDIEQYMQEPLVRPYDEPSDREAFWDEYLRVPFSKIAKKYTEAAFHRKVRLWLRKQKQKLKRVFGGAYND